MISVCDVCLRTRVYGCVGQQTAEIEWFLTASNFLLFPLFSPSSSLAAVLLLGVQDHDRDVEEGLRVQQGSRGEGRHLVVKLPALLRQPQQRPPTHRKGLRVGDACVTVHGLCGRMRGV